MDIKISFLYFLSVIFFIALVMTYKRFQHVKKISLEFKKTMDMRLRDIHLVTDDDIKNSALQNKIVIQPGTAIPLAEIKTILAVKLDHIGDVLLTTPALKALREYFPSARIVALVSQWTKDVLKNNPHVDELLFFDFFPVAGRLSHLTRKRKSQLQHLLSPYSFDLAIDFRKEPETREVLTLANPRYTAGYGGHSLPFKLTVELPAFPRRIHRAEQFLDLVRALGAQTSASEPTLYPSDEDRSFARNFLARHGVQPQDTLIGIHPGARDEIKQWFKERYAALIDKLAAEFPHGKIFLFGGPLDKMFLLEIMSNTSAKPILCDSPFALLQFAAILEKMHVFIGNNSAPVHIASAMKTPVVEIHSAFVDSREWSPYGKRNIILEADIPCAPCHKTVCRTWYYEERKPVPLFCLRLIHTEDVVRAVKKILDGSQSS